MRGCLASGYPFVFGFSVYESFESQQVAQTGEAQCRGRVEQILGGHAVLATGYDDANSASWCATRGAPAGARTATSDPLRLPHRGSLASDFWTLRVVS